MEQDLNSEVEVKAGDCKRHSRHKLRALRKTSLAAAVLLAGMFEIGHVAFSQQQQSGFDAKARSRDIFSHLNAVLSFYRQSTTPIQKIGEPNDIVYRDQSVALASQAADFAFQSAKAEAELIAAYQSHDGTSSTASGSEEQQKLQAAENNIEKQLSDLKDRGDALDHRIATAKPKDLAALQLQRKQVKDALDLTGAMKDALLKIIGMSGTQQTKGLASDVENLQKSMPELANKTPPAAPQLASLDSTRSSGLSTQAMVLFDLLGTKHSLTGLINDNDDLHKQALDLRAPLSKILRSLIGHGQQLSQQAMQEIPSAPATGAAKQAASTVAAPANPEPQNLGSITTTFKALSTATVPLSQEIIVIEKSRANLMAWQTAVDREYKEILHSLLLRLIVMAIALAIIFAGGEIWTHTAKKYVRDIRRRRQILVMRRAVVGFLSAIVLLFGFVTQFNSLATFAGFLTAGVAVGLQAILLSVAAYFFIIGRYGIKVGDRITVASVTGDVIDVGLVRFYIMELAGGGTELNPTGRVAVFSNAVLFNAGAPLYKQIPGTEYAWHELRVKLAETGNYKLATDSILKIVNTIYDEYRAGIEEQHQKVERWAHTSIAAPVVESRLQFEDGALQFWARFPVQIKLAAETDEQLTEALLKLLAENAEVKTAVASMPVIQASIKG